VLQQNDRYLLGFLLLVLALATGFLLITVWNYHWEVLVYEKGLVSRCNGRQVVVLWQGVRWVKELIMDSGGYRSHIVSIEYGNGKMLRLNQHLQDIAALGDLVHFYVAKELLPKVRAAIRRGETVAFGNLSLTPHGFEHGTKTLRFNDVHRIVIENGNLKIYSVGALLAWYSRPLGHIPNGKLLVSLGGLPL
jgi:hypothetical protein